MSAPTQDKEQHPAARAVEALMVASRIAHGLSTPGDDGGSVDEDGTRIVTLLTEVAEIVAGLAADVDALSRLDTKRVLMIADLKTRLARAAENNEELYRLTSHAVGDATERHLIVSRNRALLDLEIPLPPRLGGITPTSTNGAPQAAARTH